ncbi:Oidioi.mRNA.OKI2018_I69.YSR.g17054.t1.cds [Oikopleura dioica]|uniref:Oidioi.mRNA.OKI2018_I69.YSR.g17054.t1.cds n=1 Tax=Oikopleura dioica TaxID=34765 RepID=A0ABN7SMP3_OIKDI|nr:Oidioi.mRNA.OKI2018_I69.YSR.g17054.t1.cds [Oikopleura dioica]
MEWTRDRVKKDMNKRVKDGDFGQAQMWKDLYVPSAPSFVQPVLWKEDEVPPKDGGEWSDWMSRGQTMFDLAVKAGDPSFNPEWEMLRFREEKHFYSGSFRDFLQLWLIVINELEPPERSRAYSVLQKRVDVFENLKMIRMESPQKFRSNTNIAMTHTYHLSNERIFQKGEMSQRGLGQLSDSDKYDSEGWPAHRMVKRPIHIGGNITACHEDIVGTLRKWTGARALVLLHQAEEEPLMTSAMILVPKGDGWRVCYDGSPLTLLESKSVKCVLDDVKEKGQNPERNTTTWSRGEESLACYLACALGTFIHREKSTFVPTHRLEFLGFIFDTKEMTIAIPKPKWEKFQAEVRSVLRGNHVHQKILEQIRGKCVHFMYVERKMRLFIRIQNEAIKLAIDSGDPMIPLKPDLVTELRRWIRNASPKETRWIETGVVHLKKEIFREEDLKERLLVYTDASGGAGGLCVENLGAKEPFYWPKGFENEDIFMKEAYAILVLLQRKGSLLKNRRVLIKCDNQVVCSALYHGSRTGRLNEMVFRIYEAAERHNIEQLADEPSRTFDFNESEITDEAFDEITRAWKRKFTLDAFATKENARTERYISRFLDDQAWASDFFRFTKWRRKEVIYAFPPRKMASIVFRYLEDYAMSIPWALVVIKYERTPMAITLAKRRGLRTLKLKSKVAVISPSPKKTEGMGYYKPISDAATVWAIFNEPNLTIGNGRRFEMDFGEDREMDLFTPPVTDRKSGLNPYTRSSLQSNYDLDKVVKTQIDQGTAQRIMQANLADPFLGPLIQEKGRLQTELDEGRDLVDHYRQQAARARNIHLLYRKAVFHKENNSFPVGQAGDDLKKFLGLNEPELAKKANEAQSRYDSFYSQRQSLTNSLKRVSTEIEEVATQRAIRTATKEGDLFYLHQRRASGIKMSTLRSQEQVGSEFFQKFSSVENLLSLDKDDMIPITRELLKTTPIEFMEDRLVLSTALEKLSTDFSLTRIAFVRMIFSVLTQECQEEVIKTWKQLVMVEDNQKRFELPMNATAREGREYKLNIHANQEKKKLVRNKVKFGTATAEEKKWLKGIEANAANKGQQQGGNENNKNKKIRKLGNGSQNGQNWAKKPNNGGQGEGGGNGNQNNKNNKNRQNQGQKDQNKPGGNRNFKGNEPRAPPAKAEPKKEPRTSHEPRLGHLHPDCP